MTDSDSMELDMKNDRLFAKEYEQLEKLESEIWTSIHKDSDAHENSSSLQLMVDLAVAMKLREANLSRHVAELEFVLTVSLISSVIKHTLERQKREAGERHLTSSHTTMRARIEAARKAQDELRKVLADAKDSHEGAYKLKTLEWKSNATMLGQKREEYQTRLEKLQQIFDQSGIDEHDLRANVIEIQIKNVQDLKSQVESQQMQLSAFENLPADRRLAKLSVEEKRQEFNYLEMRRQELLSAMADGTQ